MQHLKLINDSEIRFRSKSRFDNRKNVIFYDFDEVGAMIHDTEGKIEMHFHDKTQQNIIFFLSPQQMEKPLLDMYQPNNGRIGAQVPAQEQALDLPQKKFSKYQYYTDPYRHCLSDFSP